MRKRLKGIRTEFQRLQKNADIAAATLSLSEAAVNWTYPPAKGVREPSGKGVDFNDPCSVAFQHTHASPSDRPLRGQLTCAWIIVDILADRRCSSIAFLPSWP